MRSKTICFTQTLDLEYEGIYIANRNWPSAGKIYTYHIKPVLLDCNFVVDPANGNGLGIRNLKGSCISNVFMHTTAPLAGSGNPNPPPGYIYVKLQDNYNRYLGGFSGAAGPLSGSSISISSGLTANSVYVITSVGTSTAANWNAIGLPLGVTPAPGVAFVATSSSPGTGTGTVQAPGTNGSGIGSIELVGDPNTTLSNSAQPSNGGGYLIARCLAPTSSSVTSPIATAPATGSVVQLSFYINDSSIVLAGE